MTNELSAGDKSFTAWGHYGVGAAGAFVSKWEAERADRLSSCTGSGHFSVRPEITGRARASRTLYRPSFHRLFYLGRSPARLYRQHRGSIQFAPIA